MKAQPDPSSNRSKILVIASVHWASTTRFCLALAEAGFEVIALLPEKHVLHSLEQFECHHLGRTYRQGIQSAGRLLETCLPDLVIPTDEMAIELLGAVYSRAVCGERRSHRIVELLESSVGSPSAFMLGAQKSKFICIAREEGLLVPETQVVETLHELRRLLPGTKFPAVLKQDRSFGGLAVHIVRGATDAQARFVELKASAGARAAIKKTLRKLDLFYLDRRYRSDRTITFQQHIVGRPANRVVVCHRGRVLAGLSVEALETTNSTGPATVVRFIDCLEMEEAAIHMVARLKLSGFVGFDFMLEAETGRAYLLEMNVRPTQICHLALDKDSDTIGALAALYGMNTTTRPMLNVPGRIVALFPQEYWRDPASPYLSNARHDISGQTPYLIEAYRRPLAPEPEDWIHIVQRWWRTASRLYRRKAVDFAAPPSALYPTQSKTASTA